MLPKLPKCFLAVNNLAALRLAQTARNLLFDFLMGIVLTEVSCDEVVIDCFVEELVRVGNATGLDLFRYALFDLGPQSNLQGSLTTLLLAHWNRVAEIHRPAAFADVIAVPRRNLDFDVTFHHALAAQARFERETGGHVQAVGFLIGHF